MPSKLTSLGAALFLTSSGPTVAMDFIDVAPVISATPLYGPATDPRECFVQTYAPPPGAPMAMAPQPGMPPPQPPQERSVIAPIAGGVAGALLGSQVGQGRGRDAATALGAVAGTVVTDRVVNPNSGGSLTGALIGGAGGALVGNQVGQGTGRTAATAAGAIGGSMVGDRLMSTPPPVQQQAGQYQQYAQQPGMPMQQVQTVDRCRTVDGSTREILRGFSVVYRYQGRDITTTVANHPGQSIRIAVGAMDALSAQRPAGYAPPGAYPPPGYAQQPAYQQQPGYPQQPVYQQQPGYPPQPGYTSGNPQQQQQPPQQQSATQVILQQVPGLLAR